MTSAIEPGEPEQVAAAPVAQGCSPSFWRRPARWPALVAVVLLVVVAWAGLCAVAARLLWREGVIALPVSGQAVVLQLPAGLQAKAQVSTPVATRLRFAQDLALPLDQQVGVRLTDRVQGRVQLRADVPVSTRVEIDTEVPVSAELAMDVPVVSWLPKLRVMVPLAVRVPVRTTVPIALSVPLAMDVKVDAALAGVMSVPVKGTLRSRVDVALPWRAQVVNETQYTLQGAAPRLALEVAQATLQLPLREVRWAPAAP